jgi:hypothetical protein
VPAIRWGPRLESGLLSERKAGAALLRIGLVAAAVFSPLAAAVALGAGRASLWLDEITYLRLQDDVPLRAAEIGRPGSALAPYFSNFFYCDIQRVFQALLAVAGITPGPEWRVRLLSFAACAATAVLLALGAGRLGRPAGGWAAGLAFAAAPVFLYYAFEGRVYELAALVVVLLLDRIAAAAAGEGRASVVAVALVGVFLARLHLWTLCLFAALLARAAIEMLRRRRVDRLTTVLVAASVPPLALISLEYAYMKATQPPEPLFALFMRQPLGGTLAQTGLSFFEGPLQVQGAFQATLARVFVAAGLSVLGVLVLFALREPEMDGEFGARSAAGVVVGALAISIALAVTFGYFVHGRYQVPLFAGLVWAVARGAASRAARLLLVLLAACELVLLPFSVAAIRSKSNDGEIADAILGGCDRSSAAVVVQHGVPSGYPAPHHTIGLDFYLNDRQPTEPRLPILELPDLRPAQGEHGTYRYFNGGPPLLERALGIRPASWRSWVKSERPADVWVVRTLWDVPASRDQITAFLSVLREAHYAVAGQLVAPGYPRAALIHLRRVPPA